MPVISLTGWRRLKHQRVLYLHGEGGRLLVVMVEHVWHEGGVVGQPLAHAQRDGLAGEQAVTPRRRVHRNGHARR